MQRSRLTPPHRNRPLLLEKLQGRNLFAADTFLFEDFQDQSVDGFDPILSNAASEGVVEVAPGEFAFESVFERTETQTLLGTRFGEVDSVEISFSFRLPDGVPLRMLPEHSFVGLKLSRLIAPEGSPSSHNMQNELSVYQNDDGSQRYEIMFFAEQNKTAEFVQVELVPSEWTTVRYQVFFNEPGQSDGRLKAWINGEQVVDQEGMTWAQTKDHRPINFWVGGNISFSGVDPAMPFRRQLDDIKVRTNLEQDEPPTEDPRELVDAYVDYAFDGEACRRQLNVVGTESGDKVFIHSEGDRVMVSAGDYESVFEMVDRIYVDLSEGGDRLVVEPDLAEKIVRIIRTEDVSFEPDLWGFTKTDSSSTELSNRDDDASGLKLDEHEQSETSRFDVNGDGAVTALDALQVINAINDRWADEVDSALLHDVSADGVVSALDALQIINFLAENISDEGSAPQVVDYVSFQGDRYQLYVYEGEHVRLLADSPDLDEKNIAGLISEIDRGYEVYMNVTGREPVDNDTSIGKIDIARVETTCGAGCGYLGIRGIEIDDWFFDEAVDEFAESGKPDHLFFYEMGRNFWFYQSKLEFNNLRDDTSNRGSGDFVVNGFPILMERAISEFLDIEFSGPTDGAGTQAFRDSNARWLEQYINDPSANFETVFLDFEGSLYNDPQTRGGNMGTMDFFAEIMLDVARDYGGLEFLKRFWHEVAQRPDMTDVHSAISNLVDSASIAAGEDLHDRFINKYKWNTIDYARRFADFDLVGREAFGGGGLYAVYQPNTPESLSPAVVFLERLEPTVDHDWGLGGPQGVQDDHFWAYWTGEVFFPTAEEYTFRVFADDGVRLWIDEELIIDAWQPQRQEIVGTFTPSSSGARNIRLEYFEKTGAATIQLGWVSSLFDGVVSTEYLKPRANQQTPDAQDPSLSDDANDSKELLVSDVLMPFDANREDQTGPASWSGNYGKTPEIIVSSNGSSLDVLAQDYDAETEWNAVLFRIVPTTEGYAISQIHNDLPMLDRIMGLDTDEEGNRYYATGVAEGSRVNPHYPALETYRTDVVRVVKLDDKGDVLFNTDLDIARKEADDNALMIVNPMVAGSSRLAVGDGEIAIVHSTNTDPDWNIAGVRHQMARSTRLDAGTGDVTRASTIWVSHSFDQRLLHDGEGMIEMHLGDAYPRSIVVASDYEAQPGNVHSKSLPLFDIKGELGENNTWTRLGDVVAVTDPSYGHMALFSTEKSSTTDPLSDQAGLISGPRNLAITRFNKEDGSIDPNLPDRLTVTSNGEVHENRLRWLTEYSSESGLHAERPKIVRIGENENIVLWEQWEIAGSTEIFHGVFGLVIDDHGQTVQEASLITKNHHLHRGDDAFLLDSQAGWMTGNATEESLQIHLVDTDLKYSKHILA
ncbi:MAG: PA14 domain-containing protein [Planctomycetota bacterium]